MSIPWWKYERKHRNLMINKDTSVRTIEVPFCRIEKGSYLSPVRKKFLPDGHWSLAYYDETTHVYCDTPVGGALVAVEDIDW